MQIIETLRNAGRPLATEEVAHLTGKSAHKVSDELSRAQHAGEVTITCTPWGVRWGHL